MLQIRFDSFKTASAVEREGNTRNSFPRLFTNNLQRNVIEEYAVFHLEVPRGSNAKSLVFVCSPPV